MSCTFTENRIIKTNRVETGPLGFKAPPDVRGRLTAIEE